MVQRTSSGGLRVGKGALTGHRIRRAARRRGEDSRTRDNKILPSRTDLGTLPRVMTVRQPCWPRALLVSLLLLMAGTTPGRGARVGLRRGGWVVRGGRHEKRRYSIENRRTVYGLFRPYGEGAGGTALTGIGWR